MQLRDLERLFGEVDAGYPRAALRHAFGEYAAAAADVEHRFAAQARDTVDVVEPQRVDLVQRLEFAAGIPPAVRKLAEFVEFGWIYVDHIRTGYGKFYTDSRLAGSLSFISSESPLPQFAAASRWSDCRCRPAARH